MMTSATEVPAVTCSPTWTGVGREASTPAIPGVTLSAASCFSIQAQLGLGLVDFGLLGGELDLDGLLLHLKLLLAELVLGGQLLGGALRLVVLQAADHAEFVELLVGIWP